MGGSGNVHNTGNQGGALASEEVRVGAQLGFGNLNVGGEYNKMVGGDQITTWKMEGDHHTHPRGSKQNQTAGERKGRGRCGKYQRNSLN